MTIGSGLTVRYALALTLVACTMIVTHFVEVQRIDATATDARTINVSGMQRMLSQRTALLAREISLAEDTGARTRLTDELATTLDTMAANQDELSDEWRVRAEAGDPTFVRLTEAGGLDSRVRRYVAAGRTMLVQAVGNGYSSGRAIEEVPDRLAEMVWSGFLAELDEVVKLHERDNVAKTEAIGRIGTWATFMGLSLLLLEALFIFRPMARRITSTVTDLERSNLALTTVNEELAQFNYRTSHDIVAPVTTARGFLDFAIEEAVSGDPDEVPELLKTVRDQLDKLDALIADLASLALASGYGTRMESIALEPLVEEIRAEHVEATLDGLTVDMALELVEIESDPARVRQMLANLIDNAARYQDAAEAAPHVLVSARREGTRTVIEVSDNGTGIDPKFGDRAFEMFSRNCSSVPGTGLGLYIADKHVDRLGGKLSIENHAKPTVLRITLPGSSRMAA